MVIKIRNGTIFTMDNECTILENADLYIEDFASAGADIETIGAQRVPAPVSHSLIHRDRGW